jgi:ribosome biogenesis GTPase
MGIGNGLKSGLILKGVGGFYTVLADGGETYTCAARGLFRLKKITPLPGDRVTLTVTSESDHEGALREILERKNEIGRPRAANIDCIIITVSAEKPLFDPALLDIYLMTAERAGSMKIIICLNKTDLAAPETPDRLLLPYRTAGYETAAVSAATGEGIPGLAGMIGGMISMFAGPSGAGKSSILNKLKGRDVFETGGLSEKIGRGKQTTRHTELIPAGGSGFYADSPGFSSIDLSAVPENEYASLFREFRPFINDCRYTNCRHDAEDGCAVKEQVGSAIHPVRYSGYLTLLKKNAV